MKKIFSIIVTFVIAIVASAQVDYFSSIGNPTVVTKNFPNYHRVFVSYAPMSFSGDVGKSIDTVEGFALGYQVGWSISQTCPLYLEGCLNARYNHSTEREEDENYKLSTFDNFLSLNIPISLVYKCSIEEGLSFAPYIGVHFTGNIIGEETIELKYRGYMYDSSLYTKEHISFFDEEKMMGKTANRFQLGWQIGIGLNYKALYLGVGYSAEFSEYIDDVNTGGLTLTAGLNF